MKRVGALAVLLLLFVMAAPALAYEAPVNFSVIKPDGKVAANADYKIYYTNGSLVLSGTLDADGKASFNLTDNATYIALVITSTESILDDFSIPTITDPVSQTPVDITINATALYALNVSSTPIQNVQVQLVPELYQGFIYTFNTNWSVYTDLRNNLTFPNETKSGIWTYTLKKITIDTSEYTNVTEVTIPMTGDTDVVAYYEIKYPVLEPIYLVLIIGLIGITIIAVIIVAGRRAKATARAKVEDSFRFYRRLK